MISSYRGYPACAGIDPARTSGDCVVLWLPRMRGDRPALRARGIACQMATPHARGSTLRRLLQLCRARGYPACAGIDRR